MTHALLSGSLPFTCCRWLVGGMIAASVPTAAASDVTDILADRCYDCHGPDKQKAKLRLDTAEGIASVVTAGDPAAFGIKNGGSDLAARIGKPLGTSPFEGNLPEVVFTDKNQLISCQGRLGEISCSQNKYSEFSYSPAYQSQTPAIPSAKQSTQFLAVKST